MATDKSKQHKVHIIPPHDLLVQKFTESRAPELDSLYSTIATRSNNNFKSQRNKRRRTTSHDNQSSKTRFRKKQKTGVLNQNNDVNSVKKAPPRHIRRRKELNENPQNEFCTSGNGTKRLRTHVWHAKRFTMTTRWGFHLPLGLHGRGRGSRALLKWLNNGTVVHDASYYSAVQLEGSQDSIMSILSILMSPFPSSDSENVLSGGVYATSMLHHGGQPNSGAIAPVIYMWRLNQKSTDADLELNGSEDHEKVNSSSSFRQLWVWIHAAALTEGYNALKNACESQGKVNEGVDSVRCTSLEGQFGTLEVMGSEASHLLQKILNPVISDTSSTSTFTMENEDHKSCSQIIPLVVNDPRSLTLTNNTEFDSSYTELWDISKGQFCPVEESVLCMEKHHERLSTFCLTNKTSNDDNTPPTKTGSSRFCPIILLKRNNIKDSITRWTIILPLTWVKAFWVPLISNGAHAIGIRERSWVACDAGIPSFPSEFPECNSYNSLMEAEASAIDEQASLRPESMRPFSIPILPPWNCVRLAFGSNPNEPEEKESYTVVARSARMLTGFLNAINGDRLLIFPHDKNTLISKFIRDEKIIDGVPKSIVENEVRRKVCFVRVVLRAYKEGVIEDGAVVCAPCLDDIKLWTSGSNEKVELQVPQSLLATYFAKQDSGKWEYKVPSDMESNRWPIGFVTSGFVPGSKKPVAGGLCDVALLSHLRHEQWGCVPLKKRKKEVYVLTRNLRSTAYRLALASIVLEHQEEDLDHV
ncbi:hypothetical protein LXL04_032973 [Taraxacum kok-saghyz]